MASEITQELRQSDIDELMRDVERYQRPHRELPSVGTGGFYLH